MAKRGMVYIIGAGPGDPGLITLRGVECIREADVVIYDYLVNPEILRHARQDVRRIYVGKRGGEHTLVQDEINRRLVTEAEKGMVVARIKGGDPFIFGRGGEEAEALRKAGIPFEVVPGVSSAVAVPAYAGIPLTHRNHAASVAFVTGHEDPAKEKSDLNWPALAGIGTLVFLMGVKNLPAIAENLIRCGKDPSTPAALIRWGTTPDQETLTGTLGDIARKAEKLRFLPPAVFVVGGVVALRETLNWFETKPLFGRGIVITHPEAQAEEFSKLLRVRGARVIPFPVIRIAPPTCQTVRSDRKAAELLPFIAEGQVDAITFTSPSTVRHFLGIMGPDFHLPVKVRIVCIGPVTEAAARKAGLPVDIIQERYVIPALVDAIAAYFEKEKEG